MSEGEAISVVDRSTTSFGLEVLRIKSESGDQTVALESLGLSVNMKGRLALERAREIERRSKVVSAISSPVLLKLHGIRRLDGQSYVEREDLPRGVYLVDYLKDKTVSPRTAVKWSLALAELCQEYQKAGLDIRGISDRNILVTEDGAIRVVEPGVAVILQELRGDCEDPDNFVAPESAYEDTWTPESDMFVIGVLMYEALTGVKPFDDPSPENVRENILHRKQADPRYLNPDIGERVARVIDRLLQKSPERRFASMRELRSELQSIIDQTAFTSAPREREAFERGKRRMEVSNKAWQAKRWFSRNRSGVLVAVVVVLVIAVVGLLNPETPPVVTPDMTAEQVVQVYYVALANSDSIALDEVLSKTVPDRSKMIDRASAIHVITKMQDIQSMSIPVMGTDDASRSIQRPYAIEDVQIQALAQPEQRDDIVALFVATYTETFVDHGDQVSLSKRDVVELTRIESLWKVTSIESVELDERRVPLSFD